MKANLFKRAGKLEDPVALGLIAIGLATVCFAVWAALAPINGAIIAHGLVKAETNRKAVQHVEGGVVRAIHVRDGDSVRAGQALLELENVSNDSNYQLLMELTVFETMKRERLDAEQQLAAHFRLPPGLAGKYDPALVKSAYQRELNIFRVRRESLDSQVALLKEQLDTIAQQTQATQREIAADKQGIKLQQQDLEMNQSLYQEKFVSRTRLLDSERALADYQSRLAQHESELAQAGQRKGDILLKMAAMRSDYQRAAAEEFKESSARLVEYRERLRPVEDAMRRETLTAPVSGKVVALRIHAPGEVAGPRDVLMEIVPDREEQVLEAQIPVDGIKDLYPGQTADIRFTAFKQRTTPMVTGKLTYVSADAMSDKNGVPFFVAQVLPDAASLKSAGIVALQPGMAAEIFIRTEARTTLDYLFAPVVQTLRRAFREQ